MHAAISIGVIHVYLLPGYKLCLDNTTRDIDILLKIDIPILYPLITIIYAVLFFTSVYYISNDRVKLCIVNVFGLTFVVSMIVSYIITYSETDSKLFNGTLATVYLLLSSTFLIVMFCLYQIFVCTILSYIENYLKNNWKQLFLTVILSIAVIWGIAIPLLVIAFSTSTKFNAFLPTWEYNNCKTANDNYIIFFLSQIIIYNSVYSALLYMLSKYITMHVYNVRTIVHVQQHVQEEDEELYDHDIVADTTTRAPLLSHPAVTACSSDLDYINVIFLLAIYIIGPVSTSC